MNEQRDTASQGQHNKGRDIGQRSQDRAVQHDMLAFAERKAEKLATAVYLVSDIVSEKDPMRWNLRERGIELMSVLSTARTASLSERVELLRRAERVLDAVVSLLDVARSAKMVSEMNVTILRREYVSLRGMIESEWRTSANAEGVRFSERFFDVDPRTLPRAIAAPRATTSLISNTERIDPRKDGDHSDEIASLDAYRVESEVSQSTDALEQEWEEVSVPAKTDHTQKDRSSSERPTIISRGFEKVPLDTPQRSEFSAKNVEGQNTGVHTHDQQVRTGVPHDAPRRSVSSTIPAPAPRQQGERSTFMPKTEPANSKAGSSAHVRSAQEVAPDRAGKDDRRKIILTLLGHSRDLTVKDIQKNIVGVSEKTVQRELLAMVADGTLQKKGERRWSRYSLKPGASI